MLGVLHKLNADKLCLEVVLDRSAKYTACYQRQPCQKLLHSSVQHAIMTNLHLRLL